MKPSPQHQSLGKWLWIGVGVLVTCWALRPIWDMDLWWHIALGRLILDTGFPSTDPLAVGRGALEWSTFQGGYEVMVSAVEEYLGLFGVRLIHALAVGCGVGLAGYTIHRQNGHPWLALAVAFLLLFLYEDRIRVRPHVFHFLGMSWMLFRLASPGFHWRRGDLWFLIPVIMVWSSFHGPASLWGLLLIGAGTLARYRSRESWEVAFASGIAVLVTPGVLPGLISAFSVHTRPGIQARFVPEHGNLFHYLDGGPRGFLVVALAVAGALALGAALTGLWKRRDKEWIALALGVIPMGIFSLLFARFAWYALGPILLVAVVFGKRLPTKSGWVILALAASLFTWDATQYVLPRYGDQETSQWSQDIQEGRPHHFPLAATRFLQKAEIGGQIYNEVGWGGYLLYALPRGTRTLYDSRIAFVPKAADLLIEDDELMVQRMRSLRATTGKERREGEIAFGLSRERLAEEAHTLGVDLVVRRAPVFGTAGVAEPPKSWTLLYRDGMAEVWARNDEQLSSRLSKIQKAWGEGQVQRTPE